VAWDGCAGSYADAMTEYLLADGELEQPRMVLVPAVSSSDALVAGRCTLAGIDDIAGHAVLQRELQTSLCLDESILHARYAAAAIEAGACRIINIKLGRIGGFSEAIATQALCAKASVPNWCGGMLEAGIGRAHNIAMSTLPNFKLPGDVSASKRYWKEDIIEPEVTVSSKGTIKVPDTPGRGFTIREDLIEKLTVRKETIR